MTSAKTQAHPLWRRSLARTGRIAVTAIVVGVAVVAIVGGRSVLAERADAQTAPDAAPPMTVAVSRIEMQDHYSVSRRFSGQFEARQETALAFELPGTIASVLVEEGDRVAEGDVIARLDTRLLLAEKAQLEASRGSIQAQTELARRTNDRQAELQARGFATEQTVDDTSLNLARLEAGIAEIDAALSAVSINLSKAELTAPYDGIIAGRMLDNGAVANAGAPVVTLVETGAPRFQVGLDPVMASSLSIGDAAMIVANGSDLSARLAGLSPSLDPATRSRMAWFDVVDGAMPPDRTTGEILLTHRIEKQGAWVPLSALRQGPRATWTLLVVRDGVIGLETAEILHLETDRAFVRGTFQNETAYLPGGTHRVVPGQRVAISEDLAWAR